MTLVRPTGSRPTRAGGGIRTHDLAITSRPRFQLRHTGVPRNATGRRATADDEPWWAQYRPPPLGGLRRGQNGADPWAARTASVISSRSGASRASSWASIPMTAHPITTRVRSYGRAPDFGGPTSATLPCTTSPIGAPRASTTPTVELEHERAQGDLVHGRGGAVSGALADPDGAIWPEWWGARTRHDPDGERASGSWRRWRQAAVASPTGPGVSPSVDSASIAVGSGAGPVATSIRRARTWAATGNVRVSTPAT